jgi:hypothetical protein
MLGYFGEGHEPPRGNCDVCEKLGDGAATDGALALFGVGERVMHGAWGTGTIGRVEHERITVVFDTVGYKARAAARRGAGAAGAVLIALGGLTRRARAVCCPRPQMSTKEQHP